jgi:3-oxoacid CoA-transferase subunit A
MNKVVTSAADAVADIPDGARIMIGGFGVCGVPEDLIRALHARGTRQLTIISNNAGVGGAGVALLLAAKQIARIIGTYVGDNEEFERQVRAGDLQAELIPQGTFAERMRAAGAGLGGFFTPTGVGTIVAEDKEMRTIDGREFLLEMPLHADFALVKAFRGDRLGNLVYRKTARNFNPVMAMAAAVTIAEVEELVEPGEIDPDAVVTPGIFVNRVVEGTGYEKPIERRTTR